jgi:hypothetical protein
MSTFEDFIHQKTYAIPDRDCDRPLRIGVVGYSDDSKIQDPEWAMLQTNWMIKGSIHELLERIHGRCDSFELVSGLTNCGIPGIAYRVATTGRANVDLFSKTVGIACSKANEYPQFPVDEKHIIGDEWGDESEFFLEYIDALVRIGGGEQSHREVAMFKSKYPEKPLLEVDL